MFISVVTCTRNRADMLRRLLDSFARMEVPPALRWEVVIVDNGSTDATAAVVDSFTDRLPIRCAYESEPGLAGARNRGIAAARGDYIAWTDDDCEADAQWLAAYAAAFARHPDAVLFAGRIIPRLEEPATPWFRDNLETLSWLVAARDFGDAELPLSTAADRLPFGTNAAIRTAEQQCSPYDVALGVKDGSRMVGEETSIFRSLLAAGATGWWVPGAAIIHHIPVARQTAAYVRRYFQGHGEFGAHLALTTRSRGHAGLLLHHAPRAAGNFALYWIFQACLPSRIWLRRLANLGSHLGALGYTLRDLQRGQ